MKNRILSLFLLVLLLSFGLSKSQAQDAETTLTSKELSTDWQIQSNATNAFSSLLGSHLQFNADHSFSSYQLATSGEGGSKTQKFIGQWSLDPNSKTLKIKGLANLKARADSFAYTVNGGVASLNLYFQGKKIASLDQAGFESQLVSESFTYVYNKGKNQLKLSLEGQEAMDLAMTAPAKKGLPQGGFKWMDIPRGLLGMLFVVGFCYMLSKNRKAIDWQLVGTGLAMQLGIALLVLKVPFVKGGFKAVAGFFIKLLSFTEAGTTFLFGQDLGTSAGTVGMVFGIHVLSIIIFFSAITSLLYYFGILQQLVKGFAWVMSKTMRLSGAESMAAAGNIFLGQTEAPLLVKPYLENMTKSEILCLMGGGMATIAGSVFGAYVAFLGGDDPVQQQLFATHLLTASIMAAPGAIVAAKILLPETEEVDRELNIPKDRLGDNALDAIAIGGTEGMKLAVNVGVMLLVFVALIKGVNWFMGDFIGDLTGLNGIIAETTDGGYTQLSLQYVFGMILAPVAWLLGVASEDMVKVGQLLGEKTIINEFVAFSSLADIKDAGGMVHYKSIIISTYLLCGFANISSIGIQIGGIGSLAPGQRKTLTELGVYALVVGTMAAFLTASIAGMLSGI